MMEPRYNAKLNEKIRQLIDAYRDTVFGERLRKAYQGNMSYEGLCEMCGLDPDDYDVEPED